MGSETAKSTESPTKAKSEDRSRRAPEVARKNVGPLPFLNLQRVLGNRGTATLLAPPPQGGDPLPYAARDIFDADTVDVADRIRIHASQDAAAWADAVDAEAFAFGHDIIFAAGAFSPGTTAGRKLLAHEIAHVLQQTTEGLPAATSAQAEADADAFAADVLAGRPAKVTRSTPMRAARQPKDKAETQVPARGTFYVYRQSDGAFVYVYNMEDVKTWPSEIQKAFTTYILDAFPGATAEIAQAYLREHPDTHVQRSATAPDPNRKTESYRATPQFHAMVERWMNEFHPELRSVPVPTGNRKIDDNRPPSASSGADQPLEVTVTGPPRPGKKQSDAPPQSGEPSKDPTQQKSSNPDTGGGSIYGQPKGKPDGIIQYEPLGEMTITPKLDVYVAHSRVTPRVHFEGGNEWRYVLNIFPNHANFMWTVYKDDDSIDTNLVETGRIEYPVDFEGPGIYTITVVVSSREFIDGKRLTLKSPPLKVVDEKDVQRAIFESKLVGADRDKPFERDAFGQLKVKAGWVPLSIQSEIDGLNAEIAAIERIRKDGKLSDADAKKYTDFFNEQLAGLKTIQQHVGQRPYVIAATFLNREDSSSFPMRTFMNQTGRGETDDKHAYVDVELYDSTLSPGEPRRAKGHGESSKTTTDDPAAYAAAELSAVEDAMGEWRHYNEYPDGTMHAGVQLLEGNKDIREWEIDTHTRRKTARKVLTGVAAVGGVALLIASPFTGGASASVGVLLLEGVVAGATVALVVDSINERIKTNTFHFDARFVMDMTALVTTFVGVGGAIRGLTAPIGAARNGMLIFNLGAGATNFAMMTIETQHLIDQENAQFTAQIANVTDNATKADMEEKHRARLAGIMGSACVSGGIIIVATGLAAKQGLESEPPPGLPAGQRPPPEKPLTPEPLKPATPPPRRLPAAEVQNPPAKLPPTGENVAPNTPPPDVPPPPSPPPRGPAADDTVTLYHGTRQKGYEGVSKGIDVKHAPGEHQDFGQGFYTSEDVAVAEQAAGMRPEKGGTGMRHVLRWDIPKSKLGKIVDVRPGGADRAAYEAWLKEPPSFAKEPGFPMQPGFRTNEEYLSGLGVEQRGAEFEKFLQANKLGDADTIFGDIGTPTTSGAAALPDRVSTQVTVRSQKVADELNTITRGGGPPPSGGGPPPPPITPTPPPKPPPPPAAPVIPIRRGAAAANDNAHVEVEQPQLQEQPIEQPLQRAAGDRETYASASRGPRGPGGPNAPKPPPAKPATGTTRTRSEPGRFGGGAAVTPARPTARRVPPEHLEEPQLLPRGIDNYSVGDGFAYLQRNKASYPRHVQDMIDAVTTPRMARNVEIEQALKAYYAQQANVALGFPATNQQVSRPANVPGGQIIEETSPFTSAEKGHAPSRANPGTEVEAGFSPTPSGDRKNLNLVGHTRSGEVVKLDDFNFRYRFGEELKMPGALATDPRFAVTNRDNIISELRRHYEFTRDWGFNPYRWTLLNEEDYNIVLRLANDNLPPDWSSYIRVTHIQ